MTTAINEASIELRRIARSEADNAVALASLVAAAPGRILCTAPSAETEDPFHFHPDVASQLRHKASVMMAHWRDYLDLYPAMPQVRDAVSPSNRNHQS